MKNKSGIIGVIGGAGVAASVEMLSRFNKLAISNGAKQNQEHPEVVLYQATQAPSRSLYLEGKGPSFVPYYIEAAVKLKKFGAKFLCMACNTAHVAISEIKAAAGVEIINMIEATVLQVVSQKPKKIAILCSEGSARYKIFSFYIPQNYQVEILYPGTDVQKKINSLINGVKVDLHTTLPLIHESSPIKLLNDIISELLSTDIDLIVLGCTELSLAYSYLQKNDSVIDSLDVLVKKAYQLYYEI